MVLQYPAATNRRTPWSRPTAAALVLAFAAGATDAFAFLQLGGVFTANLTGNLVLVGLTHRPGYTALLVGVASALLAFVLGLFVSFRLLRRFSLGGARAVLALGAASQTVLCISWILNPSPGSPWAQAPLVALSALAMAAQTAVSKQTEVRSGVSTTYVTGTITSLVADWSDKRRQDWVSRIGVLVLLVLGALAGSTLVNLEPAFGAALPILPAVVGTVILTVHKSERCAPETLDK